MSFIDLYSALVYAHYLQSGVHNFMQLQKYLNIYLKNKYVYYAMDIVVVMAKLQHLAVMEPLNVPTDK